MKKSILLTLCLFGLLYVRAGTPMTKGTPSIQSMGVLHFNDNGVLFIGDSKAGTIFALDLDDNEKNTSEEPLKVQDLEAKIAGLLGTTADDILIHDLAVNPISQNAYLSVSRGKSGWTSNWQMPKELEDAKVLLKVSQDGTISEVDLNNILFSKVSLPNPIDAEKEHKWKKGSKLRADAISDIAFDNDKLYVSGLSNEEFASSMWVIPYPFNDQVESTTLEIYHGAHGAYETNAPIRAFLPYTLNSKPHIIASYLCTPLVTFGTEELKNGDHVRGKTVAEFGAGNFPIDMVIYKNDGKDYILMSNSQLPLLVFDPADVASFDEAITTEVEGYMAGVKYTPRSGAGIYHLADYNKKYVLATQRLASGKLSLSSLSKEWLRP